VVKLDAGTYATGTEPDVGIRVKGVCGCGTGEHSPGTYDTGTGANYHGACIANDRGRGGKPGGESS